MSVTIISASDNVSAYENLQVVYISFDRNLEF